MPVYHLGEYIKLYGSGCIYASLILHTKLCHGFIILISTFHIITSHKAQVIKDVILQFHGLTRYLVLRREEQLHIPGDFTLREEDKTGGSHGISLPGSLLLA